MEQNICALSHSNCPAEASNVRDEIGELKDVVKKLQIENNNIIKSLETEMKAQRELNEKIIAEIKELHKLLKVELNDNLKRSEEYLEEKINNKVIKENKKMVEFLKETQQKMIDKAVKEALFCSDVKQDDQTKQQTSNDHM